MDRPLNRRLLRTAGARGAAFLALAVAAACSDTTAAPVSTDPFYKVTPTIADSTKIAAGSIVTVKALITHEGTPAALTAVGWVVTAGGGVVSAAASSTDTLGTASIRWVLGNAIGVNTLAISTANGTDTLHIVGVAGAASYLVPEGADSFTTAPNVSVTLQGRVTDRLGNVVPSTTVKWTTSGGSLSASTSASNASGIAAINFSAAVRGTYTVTGELPGLATHIYQVVVQ